MKSSVKPMAKAKSKAQPPQQAPKASTSWIQDNHHDLAKVKEFLSLSDDEKWYSKCPDRSIFTAVPSDNPKASSTTDPWKVTDPAMISAYRSKLDKIIQDLMASKKVSRENLSSDEKWMNDVIRSGTLSDKIAALALKVQGNPVLELDALHQLMQYASKKEQRPAQLALEAIKDLLISNLLPDRHLVPLQQQPLKHPKVNLNTAILMWYEDKLVEIMRQLLSSLDQGLKSTVDHFKKSSMAVVKDLLVSKPEQEARLLTMIVNKLGDPSTKISAYAVELLNEVIRDHLAMRSIVIREVRQFISYPNLKPKVIYSGILFLSQISMRQATSGASVSEIALQLVDTYVSLFQRIIPQEELKSKLLSAILVGINKVFPYFKDKQAIVKHMDALFRLVHESSFTTSTQALILISYMVINDKSLKKNKGATAIDGDASNLSSRFYRALYATLSSDTLLMKTRNTIFLNLLYRSMKHDPIDLR
jgi:ribosome biogenesis protein MAK21